MGWEARTNFVEVKVGTCLCIYESPQIQGEPEPLLIGNQPLKIEAARGNWIFAQVQNAEPTSAILVMPDGLRFEITPRRADEFDCGVDMQRMYSRDWIVRSQIVDP